MSEWGSLVPAQNFISKAGLGQGHKRKTIGPYWSFVTEPEGIDVALGAAQDIITKDYYSLPVLPIIVRPSDDDSLASMVFPRSRDGGNLGHHKRIDFLGH